jgi:PST family polysaccharide transporter
MKRIAKQIKENPFINASFYSGISSVIKIITSLLIGKIIAQLSGAEGMVLYGQMLSFVVLINVFSGGAMTQGVTKYVAEYSSSNVNNLSKLLSTSLKLTLYLSVFLGVIMIILSEWLSQYILYNSNYFYVFIVFGVTVVFYSVNNFLLAILNGYKQFKKFNVISILVNLSGLLITILLSYYYNIEGTLISIVLNQSIILLITIYFLRKEQWLKKSNFNLPIDLMQLKLLSGFALVAILSTALTPISSIIIRNYLIKTVSLVDAGLYEFVLRISGSVILFFTLTISTYYLPRISEINNKKELLNEVKKTYYISLPVIMLLLVLVYFLRDFIIVVLASKEFIKSSNLFIYVLIGVFFKVSTQIVGFVFLSKAKITQVIIIEVLFNVGFTLLSIILISSHGLLGAVESFLISNIVYFISVVILFYYTFVKNESELC